MKVGATTQKPPTMKRELEKADMLLEERDGWHILDVTGFTIIGAAVALAIGEYAILSYYYGNEYLQRYKKMQKAFADWQNDEIYRMIKTLLLIKGEEKERAPEKWVQVVLKWVRKNTAVLSLDTKYWNLGKTTKVILSLCALSVISGLLDLFQTGSQQPSSFLQLSVLLFAAAVLLTIYYVWTLHNLTTIIAQFELGKSIEEIIETIPAPPPPP